MKKVKNKTRLNITTEKILGLIESISAIGMLVSSLYLGMKELRNGYKRMLNFGIFLMGVFIILLGTSTNLWVIGITGFLLFASLPFINTSADVLIRTHIPNEKQGRVWGIVGVLSQLGYICAYLTSGFLADYVFNPLLIDGGLLGNSIGKIIGIGNGRGIGLMFMLSGLLIIISGYLLTITKSIHCLEVNP